MEDSFACLKINVETYTAIKSPPKHKKDERKGKFLTRATCFEGKGKEKATPMNHKLFLSKRKETRLRLRFELFFACF
jgi:hypothetical protein